MQWSDLTPDQQCVLLNAVEESFLFDVLNECGRGEDWPDRMPQVPYLAGIVEDMVKRGWVVLYTYSDAPGYPIIDIPNDQAHAILSDPANWWSPGRSTDYLARAYGCGAGGVHVHTAGRRGIVSV